MTRATCRHCHRVTQHDKVSDTEAQCRECKTVREFKSYAKAHLPESKR
ncbi:MAG: hypothetical protein KGL39_34570 [Patescibacteria group bacterium]|nr:hypothetical protein [Patescibacteria group bacterium]